jgi:hypothetical protein
MYMKSYLTVIKFDYKLNQQDHIFLCHITKWKISS